MTPPAQYRDDTNPVEGAFPESDVMLFRSLIEQSFVGVYIVQNGKFRYANEKMARIFGYSPDEFIGKLGPADVVHPEDWPSVHERSRKRLTGEIEKDHYWFRGIRKNGEIIFLEVYGSRILYQEKPAVIGSLIDITDRKRAEEALTESETKYRNLVEQAFVGVFINQDGKFPYANPKMAEIFGYLTGEFIGKLGPEDVIFPEDYPHIHERSRKRLIGTIERDYYQFRGVKKGGEIIYVEVYGSRIEYRGKPAVIGVLSDITDRKLAEEALRREIQRKNDFITVASHELRTPLQPIFSCMDLMLLDPKCYGLNEEALKLMEHIKQSAEREGRIISRMLEYSTVEIEKKCLQPVLKNISLRTIIEVLIGSRGYHKEVEIDLAIPPAITIVADMDYLFEILAEILTNAVHYSLPPRKIGISYREDETCWYIAIRDNGVGMTQETLNGIFKPFFIGDGNQLSRRYGRIGLGLSIARNRADIMRAHISVESAPGKGSTFTLKLPKYHHKDVIT